MRIFLRSLALSVACAVTGAATALLVITLSAASTPTCPDPPVLEIHYPPPAPAALASPLPTFLPPAPGLAHPSRAGQIPEGAVHCATEERCHIDAAFLETVLDNPATFSRQLRIMPSIKGGVMKGLKIYGIRPGSLAKLLGLKNGDLLVAIDGTPATGLANLPALINPPPPRTVVLDFVRKGEPMQRQIRID